MKTIPTTRGVSYAITCAEACIVTAADGSILLQHAAEQAQSNFIAIDSFVILSADSAIITPVFSNAALGGSSQGGAKSMPVVMLHYWLDALELKGGVMYRIILPDAPNNILWNELSMEAHADKVMTCEICIDARIHNGHEVFWPISWIWLDGQSAPDLSTGGLRYFSVRSDHGLTFIAEHTCYIEA